ncbi:MAG: LAGLIDADG family homing endonuclease [Candidatus Niyogibacteria bacterium]|nr:LAGLIDADG family homing endonuclease [Candidatus Niyogibacteria bacterium]
MLAYVVGVALGDGNLSNPNGRATRLRITCNLRYKKLLKRIKTSIQKLLPYNRVSIVKRARTYADISCYSNRWEEWLGWKAKNGPKYKQRISIPGWIKNDRVLLIQCLRGLLETDGSLYRDRGYIMVGFVTIIPALAKDMMDGIQKLGFYAHGYKVNTAKNPRYNIRLSKNVQNFIRLIDLKKD